MLKYHQDPSTNAWQEWAAQESNSNMKAADDIIPSEIQLHYITQSPLQCFCGKPVYKIYTHEYGPVFECGRFDVNASEATDASSPSFVCCYHVHEKPWNMIKNTIKKQGLISPNFVELACCPLFNFTFCSIFGVQNKFRIGLRPGMPMCFCNQPVCMDRMCNQSIVLECQNRHVDGVPKCCWELPVHKVAFPKPTRASIHSAVSLEEYEERRMLQLKKLLQQKNQEEQHKTNNLFRL